MFQVTPGDPVEFAQIPVGAPEKITLDISEMTNMDTQEPADDQWCEVAAINQRGELVSYFKSAQWMEWTGDWCFSGRPGVWLIDLVDSLLGCDSDGDLTFYWKPAPASSVAGEPCDRP